MENRAITLEKKGVTYVFRYAAGREEELVGEIIRLAEGPAARIDWLDAARLGFQIAQHALAECCRKSSLPAHAKGAPKRDASRLGASTRRVAFGGLWGPRAWRPLGPPAKEGPCSNCL